MSYTFTEINNINTINDLKTEWQLLHTKSINPSIYNSFEFVTASLELFNVKGSHPYILLIHRNNELVAIFYNEINTEKYFGLNLSVIESTAQQEIDKPYPVIHKNHHNEVWQQYFIYLEKKDSWDIYRAYEVDTNIKDYILNNLSNNKFIIRINEDKKGPTINLNLNWEEYLSSHKKMRKKLSRIEKKYINRIRFEVSENSIDALETFKKTERNSWKSGKVGICRDQNTQDFYNRLQEKISQNTSLTMTIGILYVDNTPISGEIAYTSLENVYFCHGCYDKSYAELSPGMVSTAYFLKYFMNKDYAHGDFLCGYAGYLDAWSDQITETIKIDIYRKSTFVRFFFLIRAFKKVLSTLKIRPTND